MGISFVVYADEGIQHLRADRMSGANYLVQINEIEFFRIGRQAHVFIQRRIQSGGKDKVSAASGPVCGEGPALVEYVRQGPDTVPSGEPGSIEVEVSHLQVRTYLQSGKRFQDVLLSHEDGKAVAVVLFVVVGAGPGGVPTPSRPPAREDFAHEPGLSHLPCGLRGRNVVGNFLSIVIGTEQVVIEAERQQVGVVVSEAEVTVSPGDRFFRFKTREEIVVRKMILV